jgi:hypothetical protein
VKSEGGCEARHDILLRGLSNPPDTPAQGDKGG